jgi:hypothetical protein
MASRKRKPTTQTETPEAKSAEPEMRISYEPLSWLAKNQAPRNPKKHDVEGVSASMGRFGYTIPIAIDEGTSRVVAGHGRIEVLLALRARGGAPPARVRVDERGEWLVPVLHGLAFANAEEAEAYLLADNRHTEVGGYDDAMLADMLADVRESIGGLDGIGWSDEQVTDIIASVHDAAGGADQPADRVPPEDFQDHNAESKATVHCPRCGFPVTTDQ